MLTCSDREGRCAMTHFPDFVRMPCNRVANVPDPSMEGYFFEGEDDVQVVFWECENGGESPEHVHDFWEYAVVVEGTFDGLAGEEEVHLGPGEECVIPPGVVHSGRYSKDYRAIDVFSAKRVSRSDQG